MGIMTDSPVMLAYRTRSGRYVHFGLTTNTDGSEIEITSVTGAFSFGSVMAPEGKPAEVITHMMLINYTDTSDWCIVRDGEKNIQPVQCVGKFSHTCFKLDKPFTATRGMKVYNQGEGGS